MNTNKTINSIADELAKPQFSGWSAGTIRIGRLRMDDVNVGTREGAIHFMQTLELAIDKTKRSRPDDGVGPALRVQTQGPTKLLSEQIEIHIADMRKKQLSVSSLDAAGHTLRMLIAATGDIPVSKIDQDHIRTMWDCIRWWPRNARGTKKYRHLETAEICALGKVENVPAPSVHVFNGHWRMLRTFFNRLISTKVLPNGKSPLEGLEFEVDSSMEPSVGRAYTDEELKTIFNPDSFFPWAMQGPHRWWVPAIGLYTGARVGEISQLKVSDVFKDGDTWCLRIHKTFDAQVHQDGHRSTGQKVKGLSSVRSIPIAQPLLDAGFLDFVDDIRATKHPRLFPHLGLGRNLKTGEERGRGYATRMVDQFSTYTRGLGIEKGVAMHAFRHTISTELRIKKVPDYTVAQITGHARRDDYPALRKHYQHVGPAVLLSEAAEALALFERPVKLLPYTKGQFKSLLREEWRFHR